MQHQIALFILRTCPALFMLVSHGWGKLMGFASMKDSFPDPLGVSSQVSLFLTIGSEVVCAALLAVGLFSRLVSIPLAFTMFVAAFVIHANDPFSKKEFALMYLITFLATGLLGPGKWSLDFLLRKKI